MLTRRLRITGKVQGVGYREALLREAARLGVAGWVRNRRDGSVEALVQGEAEALADLVRWARTGPSTARVEKVTEAPDAGASAPHASFEIRPTV